MENATIWANSVQMVLSDLSLSPGCEVLVYPAVSWNATEFHPWRPILGQTGVRQIVGSVRNPTGAFISDASAIAQNVTTGETKTVTMASGGCVVSDLRPSNYA